MKVFAFYQWHRGRVEVKFALVSDLKIQTVLLTCFSRRCSLKAPCDLEFSAQTCSSRWKSWMSPFTRSRGRRVQPGWSQMAGAARRSSPRKRKKKPGADEGRLPSVKQHARRCCGLNAKNLFRTPPLQNLFSAYGGKYRSVGQTVQLESGLHARFQICFFRRQYFDVSWIFKHCPSPLAPQLLSASADQDLRSSSLKQKPPAELLQVIWLNVGLSGVINDWQVLRMNHIKWFQMSSQMK